MLLKTKGKPHLLEESIVARVTRTPINTIDGNYILIAQNEINLNDLPGPLALLTNLPFEEPIDYPSVYGIPSFDHLCDGDLVLVNTDGVINTLYRKNSGQNFLLITERCNSNCLMCSQPPRDRDDSYLMDIYRKLIPMIPKDCIELGLTGGEPTLLGENFFSLLELIKVELTDTEVHCLTNGRSFAWQDFSNRLDLIAYDRLMLGIPLYSDHYAVHDYIVQARDAFNQTMLGLYNLGRNGQRIEIRIVLHQQTIPRLVKLSHFIYKNLPFVQHIAFMGLENQGYTPHNLDKLWIDPLDYRNELADSVLFLDAMGLNVSIYNLQLCILPKELWPFTRKSISDWKNIFLPECSICVEQENCGGFFQSSLKKHSAHIKAISAETQN